MFFFSFEVHADHPVVNELMSDAAKQLNLKGIKKVHSFCFQRFLTSSHSSACLEHLVTGIDGVARLICGPVDIVIPMHYILHLRILCRCLSQEAHIGPEGEEGGIFLIDYQRLMPPETPTTRRGVHLYRLLRPEVWKMERRTREREKR